MHKQSSLNHHLTCWDYDVSHLKSMEVPDLTVIFLFIIYKKILKSREQKRRKYAGKINIIQWLLEMTITNFSPRKITVVFIFWNYYYFLWSARSLITFQYLSQTDVSTPFINTRARLYATILQNGLRLILSNTW